jgi:hypothetical protein
MESSALQFAALKDGVSSGAQCSVVVPAALSVSCPGGTWSCTQDAMLLLLLLLLLL